MTLRGSSHRVSGGGPLGVTYYSPNGIENLFAGRPFIKPFSFPSALMAPSPQKASWRRIDTAHISSSDVEVGGNSSGAVM